MKIGAHSRVGVLLAVTVSNTVPATIAILMPVIRTVLPFVLVLASPRSLVLTTYTANDAKNTNRKVSNVKNIFFTFRIPHQEAQNIFVLP